MTCKYGWCKRILSDEGEWYMLKTMQKKKIRLAGLMLKLHYTTKDNGAPFLDIFL